MREDFDAMWHEFAEFRCMMACKQRQETLLLGRKLFKVKPQMKNLMRRVLDFKAVNHEVKFAEMLPMGLFKWMM
jgi:hypothetical protein